MLLPLVQQFTETHQGELLDDETGYIHHVETQSYWTQLEEIVYSGGGATSTGNANPSRILVNSDALELKTSIVKTVNEQWPGAGRRHLLRKPTPEKIRLWAAHARGNTDEEKHLAGLLTKWINQIDALDRNIDTTFPPCPECERDHIIIDTTTGPRQHQALESDGRNVWCNSCDTRWEGIPGMKLLARVLDQTVNA